MTAEFSNLVPVEGELVLRVHLGGQAAHSTADAGIVDRLLSGGRAEARALGSPAEEAVGDVLVDAPVAVRREEPEAVLFDRSTFRDVDIPDPEECVRRREPPVLEVLREVVRLQRVVGGRGEQCALEGVAAVAWDHVRAHTTGRSLGVDAARLVGNLLEHHLVEVALDAAVPLDAVQDHAVNHEGHVAAVRPVDRDVAILHAGVAAHVR